ncbi:MAG: sensor histidine kinase [Terriglobia bacterium]
MKETRRSIRLALICFMLALPAFALPSGKSIWEYDRRIWQTQDGLPEDTIQAIAQTQDGYLWIGTREGLARFDGFRFVIFDRSNTPAFGDDSVLALCETKNGVLWIGTEGGGLVRYEHGSFISYNSKQGLTDGFVRAIYEDRLGDLLVGTDHGLFRLRGGRFIRVDGQGGLPLISVHAITEDHRGRLWVGGSGLFVIDRGTVKRIVLDTSAASDQIKSVFESRDGTIWVGTYAGLYRLQNGVILHTSFDRDVEANICEDQSGNVWVGWVGGGLSRFHGGGFLTYRAPGVLPNNTVLSIFEDSGRDLWVGTENGLLRMSNTGVSVLENKDGLSLGNASTIYENVCTIYEAPDGTLWIANGHLYRIAGWLLIPFNIPSQIRKIKVRTVFKDKGGALWIGTGGQGVVKIVNGTVTEYTTRQGLVNDFIRAFCEDRHGNLWIGTDGGVSRWDGRSFKNFSTTNGLAYPSVRAIVRSKDGDLWVGTDSGLSRIHNGLFISDPALDRLRGDQIWAIHQDAQGELWLGTHGDGLFRLKDGKLSHYTAKCGLPDDNIYQILQDRHRTLWFSGRAGIFQISLQNLDSNVDCKPSALAPTIYGSSESSEAGEVNGGVQPAGSSTRSGVLWFPTIKGAIRIEPDEVRSSRQPKALIEQVIADGRDIPLTAPSRIPPGQGKLEIHYTAPSLHAPEHIRFKYRLEGFDRQWTDAATRRVAYYTNLPPGNYRFQVIAFDNDASAEGSEADFPFDWQAHFYQTAWFYALCALLIGTLGWAGFRIHMAQTKARYSAVLAERNRLAREMHDTVIQGCVGVSTLLEAASSFQHPSPEMARDLLDRARVQVWQTLNEAREAVWNLRYTSLESHSIAPALAQLARRFAEEGGVHVQAETTGTPMPLGQQVTSNLLLVAREAARNALTHANPKTVVIRVAFARKKLCMEITDDGCGFDLAALVSTQNRHYGIVGMRERIEQLGGQLHLESQPGKGTRVTAAIPVRG